MDEDTVIEMKIVQKDAEEEFLGLSLPMTFTLGELRDWLQDNLDFGSGGD